MQRMPELFPPHPTIGVRYLLLKHGETYMTVFIWTSRTIELYQPNSNIAMNKI